MEDPRLRQAPIRPYRPLLDWTRVQERVSHAWHLINKPWPSAAIDTTFDWHRARLLWKTRAVDPHTWSTLRCAWYAYTSASRLEPAAAVAGGVAAAAAVVTFRNQRGVLAGACVACASLRYGGLVPWLAFTIYNDKSWHPALESAEQLFMPWRREYRRGVDQTGRLSMLPAHLTASALLPATIVLLAGYVLTSPVVGRVGLLRRLATAQVLATRGERRLGLEVEQVLREAPSLRKAQATEVAKLRLAAALPGIDWTDQSKALPMDGLSKWWVTTDFGYPYLDSVAKKTPSTSNEEPSKDENGKSER